MITRINYLFTEFISPESHMVEINGHRYTICPFLSKGSFGSVYGAKDEAAEEMVAIKLITDTGVIKKEELFKKATTEIDFLEKLTSSKNVVTIRNSEVLKDSSVAIVMEMCYNSLQDLMDIGFFQNGIVLPKDVISGVVPFLVDAIEQLRSKNIVHFDLKPGNILRCGKLWKVRQILILQNS